MAVARKPKVQVKKPDNAKKTGRSLKPKIIPIDDVYRLINRVQLNKKEVHFALLPEDAVVAVNVLKDIGLKYEKKELKTRIEFTVFPNEEDAINEEATDIDIDFFADEIPEDGQLF